MDRYVGLFICFTFILFFCLLDMGPEIKGKTTYPGIGRESGRLSSDYRHMGAQHHTPLAPGDSLPIGFLFSSLVEHRCLQIEHSSVRISHAQGREPLSTIVSQRPQHSNAEGPRFLILAVARLSRHLPSNCSEFGPVLVVMCVLGGSLPGVMLTYSSAVPVIRQLANQHQKRAKCRIVLSADDGRRISG